MAVLQIGKVAMALEIESLRDQLAATQAREAELMADNARLRGYITRILEYWTQDGNNQELFDMLCHIEEMVKAELAATPAQSLAAITDPLNAHIERLREALEFANQELRDWLDAECKNFYDSTVIGQALAATPAQSLTRLRNEVLEEAAKVCDEYADDPVYCGNAIRAMKEPE